MPRRENDAADPIVQSPSCPRCGYDLTGVVASWSEQCSLDGVCSECGLEFAWCDLLVESRRKIPWLYEHRRGPAAGCAIKMIPRALQARRFWRTVKLHHRPNVLRLALFPLMVFVGLWSASVLAGFVIFGVRYMIMGSDANIRYLSTESSLDFLLFSQFGLALENRYGGYESRPLLAVLSTVMFSGGMLLSLLIARSSRRISKVSTPHLIRVFSYGLTISMLLYAVYAALWVVDRVGIEDYGSLQGSGSSHSWGFTLVWIGIRVSAWALYMKWWFLFGAPTLWLMLWWWCALRIGFRLEQWKQVFVAGVCLGILFASSVLLFGGVWLSMM